MKIPGSLNNLISGFSSLFIYRHMNKPQREDIPDVISGYHLLRRINNVYSPFYSGIYVQNGKKVFIKTWKKGKSGLVGHLMKRELLINRILIRVAGKTGAHLNFASPIEFIESERHYSAVFSYVSGKSLSDMPDEIKRRKYSEIQEALRIISGELSREEMNDIGIKTKFFFLEAFIVMTVLGLLNPKLSKSRILSFFFRGIKEVVFSKSDGFFQFAHGDFCSENIIIDGEKTYLIDNEKAFITYPNYDLYYLYLIPEGKKNKDVLPALPRFQNRMLWAYLNLSTYLFNTKKNE